MTGGSLPSHPTLLPALTLLRRLLLLPLLAPLLAVLLLAALNPKPMVSVRLLTGRSPVLPLGVWLAAGGAGGALLSGLTTALALREGRRRPRGRVPEPQRQEPKPWFATPWSGSRGPDASEPAPPRSAEPELDGWPQAGPQRGPGEPPPTVSVPFRVLRRPQRAAAPGSGRTSAAAPSAEPPRGAVQQGRETAGADDWDSMADEDW